MVLLYLLVVLSLFGIGYADTDVLAEAKKWEKRVYLASYPRSGNHWVRFLIEEATGIATSSVYQDIDRNSVPHLNKIFPWGGYCAEYGYLGQARYPLNGEPVVVKTHYPLKNTCFDKLPYTHVIRIIRHPIDSFYSNYVFREVQRDNEVQFLFPSSELARYINSWRKFQEHWDSLDHVLTIRYEDLFNYPIPSLKKIIDCIGYHVSYEDIARAVRKYPPCGGLLKHREHFTQEDLLFIQNQLGDLMQTYGYEIFKLSR